VGVIAAQPQVGPGESFVWYPPSNLNGTLSAFGVKLTDAVVDSAEVIGSVLVSNYNTAPTNLASYLVSGTRYPNASVVSISHSALRTGLSVSDDTDAATAVTFRVESIIGGQGLNYASTAGCAATTGAVVAGSTSINSSQDLCWIPPAGVVGTYDAFRVSVVDSAGAASPTVAMIQVTLSGSDTGPGYYGSYPGSPTYNVVKASGTVTWTYEQLKGLSGAYDTDSAAVSLMITYVNPSVVGTNIGTLVKNGGVSMFAWGGALGGARSSATVNNGNILVPGESITFQSISTSGLTVGTPYEAFRFAAVDSTTVASTAKSIYITPQNASTDYNPNFSYVGPIPIGSKQTATVNEITYAQLRAYANAFDINETSTQNMRFRIIAVGASIGTVTLKKSGGSCAAISVPANDTYTAQGFIIPGDTICYQTPNNTDPTGNVKSILQIRAENINASQAQTSSYPTLSDQWIQVVLP
jgi:hypothetical protein